MYDPDIYQLVCSYLYVYYKIEYPNVAFSICKTNVANCRCKLAEETNDSEEKNKLWTEASIEVFAACKFCPEYTKSFERLKYCLEKLNDPRKDEMNKCYEYYLLQLKEYKYKPLCLYLANIITFEELSGYRNIFRSSAIPYSLCSSVCKICLPTWFAYDIIPNKKIEYYYMDLQIIQLFFEMKENYTYLNFYSCNIQANTVKTEENITNLMNYITSYIEKLQCMNIYLTEIELSLELHVIAPNLRKWFIEKKMKDIIIQMTTDLENYYYFD